MGIETAAETSSQGARPKEPDRRLQRTVCLSDAEITAVEAAELMPQCGPRTFPTSVFADA